MQQVTAATTTIPLLEQIKASRAIYERALGDIESLSDADLRAMFASADTVARVLSIASADTVDRVLSIASDGTVARVLSIASDGTVARVLSIASAGTVDRVLSIASDGTVARVLSIASDGTVDRVLSIASADTVARVLSIASDGTVDRVLSIASDGTVDRVGQLRGLLVPVVADLDTRVAEAVGVDGSRLRMDRWHCGTSHCRAGWAVTLAGEAGAELERVLGSEFAGRLIYEASTGRPAPDFFAGNEAALADIRRCAAEAS